MTGKNIYLIGIRLLDDMDYECLRLSDEEQKAIETTRNALARLYAQECIADINFGNAADNSRYLEVFCEKLIGRIKAYNKAAEDGIEQYITEQEAKEG